MMIKSYIKFIKENFNSKSWLSKSEILDIFDDVTDFGYIIDIDDAFFGKKGFKYQNNKMTLKDNEIDFYCHQDGILPYEKYKRGYLINIISASSYSECNLSIEFNSSISQIKGEGYHIYKIVDDKNENVNIENIILYNSNIYLYIPENINKKFKSEDDLEDADIFDNMSNIIIFISQDNEEVITPLELSKIYNWECDDIINDDIYCDIHIKEMLNFFLSKNDYEKWSDIIINGFDYDDYYYNHILDLDEIENYLTSDMYNTFINHIKFDEQFNEIIKNNKLNANEIFKTKNSKLLKSIDIYLDISDIINDHIISSLMDKNYKEIINCFNENIKNENIIYEKIIKNQEIFYKIKITKEIIEVFYNDVREFTNYEISDIFEIYCDECGFRNELKPNLSEHPDINYKELNNEVKNYLSKSEIAD